MSKVEINRYEVYYKECYKECYKYKRFYKWCVDVSMPAKVAGQNYLWRKQYVEKRNV